MTQRFSPKPKPTTVEIPLDVQFEFLKKLEGYIQNMGVAITVIIYPPGASEPLDAAAFAGTTGHNLYQIAWHQFGRGVNGYQIAKLAWPVIRMLDRKQLDRYGLPQKAAEVNSWLWSLRNI